MLTVKRRLSESLILNADIEVEVVSISHYAVELVIEAPANMPIGVPATSRTDRAGRSRLRIRRHREEIVTIGDHIRILIIRLTPKVATLGLEAPADVRIVRGECFNGSVPHVSQIKQPQEVAQ